MLDTIAQKLQSYLPRKKLPVFAEKHLLHSSLPYYLLTSLMMIAQFGDSISGFFFIWIVYTFLPLADEFFSLDIKNPTQKERKELEKNDFYFKLALYVTVVFDWMIFFKFLGIVSKAEFTLPSVVNIISLVFIFSNLNSVQFAVAHEIFHKQGSFHKYLGTIHMIKNLYMHFTYQHLYGHHRRVATPEDPASAPKSMNLYSFLIKTYIGSFKSVYEMEVKEKKPFYQNYAVLSVVSSIMFTIAIFSYFGTFGGIMFLIEAYGSIFYLQAINYIEHYGLRRKKLENGEYEKVTIRHSWNAPHRFTNYLLFKLQRHSDHHQNSLKPYQTLVSLDQSPQLPHGYSVCIFMSFFPKTWFKVMDPLVDEYNNTKSDSIAESDTMKVAVKETRKFIIKLGIITTTFFALSIILT